MCVRNRSASEELRRVIKGFKDNKNKTSGAVRSQTFLPSWQLTYGLRVVARDPVTLSPTEVRCRFCEKFQRETEDQSSRKRKKTQTIKSWTSNYRADKFREHLKGNHQKRFAEYSVLDESEKKRFLQIDSLFKRKKGNFIKTIFRIDAVIVNLIKTRFLEEDEILRNFTRADNESEFYEFELRNKNRFKVVLTFIKWSASFRLCSNVVCELVKDELIRGNVGYVYRDKVSDCIRGLVAINLQAIRGVLKKSWSFSLAFDVGNNADDGYLSVRLRTEARGKLLNLHVVALPLNESHTGDYLSKLVIDALDAIDDNWKLKLLSLSSDGAANMTGRHSGLVSRLQRLCYAEGASKIFRTWCALHQLDLCVKKLLKTLHDETFIDCLTGLSNWLRRQQNFAAEYGKCPRFIETRWITTCTVLQWIIMKRSIIEDILLEKQPAVAPSDSFWVLVYVVHAFLEPVEHVFKCLQGSEITIIEQERALSNLASELMEQGRIQEYTEEEISAGSPSFRDGSFVMCHSDGEVLIGEMMTACGEKYESLTLEEREAVLDDVLRLYCSGVRGINNIVVDRDRENEAESNLFPIMPTDWIENEGAKFKELLKSMKPRLLETFSETDVDKIELQFRSLKAVKYRDVALYHSLLDNEEASFTKAWSIAGTNFELLRSFSGGFASIFANSATVESDFSRIKFEKHLQRQKLNDLTMEGILHAKQFQQLQDYQ